MIDTAICASCHEVHEISEPLHLNDPSFPFYSEEPCIKCSRLTRDWISKPIIAIPQVFREKEIRF